MTTKWKRWCECGRPALGEACERCTKADGDDKTGAVISALRLYGGEADIHQVAEDIGRTTRTVLRAMAELAASRRVERVVEPSENPNAYRHRVIYRLVGGGAR